MDGFVACTVRVAYNESIEAAVQRVIAAVNSARRRGPLCADLPLRTGKLTTQTDRPLVAVGVTDAEFSGLARGCALRWL